MLTKGVQVIVDDPGSYYDQSAGVVRSDQSDPAHVEVEFSDNEIVAFPVWALEQP